jgi:hypothetical protein
MMATTTTTTTTTTTRSWRELKHLEIPIYIVTEPLRSKRAPAKLPARFFLTVSAEEAAGPKRKSGAGESTLDFREVAEDIATR